MEQARGDRIWNEVIKVISPFVATVSFLFFVSALGFHVLARLAGKALFPMEYTKYLFMSMFVTWLPSVLISQHLTRDFKNNDFWKAALRGCPKWMRYLTWSIFGYTFINLLFYVLSNPPKGSIKMGEDLKQSGFVTGFILVFSWIPVAVNYSAIQVAKRDPQRACPRGHPVSPSAQYCPECGSRIQGGVIVK